jgi:hypothetical protein
MTRGNCIRLAGNYPLLAPGFPQEGIGGQNTTQAYTEIPGVQNATLTTPETQRQPSRRVIIWKPDTT